MTELCAATDGARSCANVRACSSRNKYNVKRLHLERLILGYEALAQSCDILLLMELMRKASRNMLKLLLYNCGTRFEV